MMIIDKAVRKKQFFRIFLLYRENLSKQSQCIVRFLAGLKHPHPTRSQNSKKGFLDRKISRKVGRKAAVCLLIGGESMQLDKWVNIVDNGELEFKYR
jgi:hypothetical protein